MAPESEFRYVESLPPGNIWIPFDPTTNYGQLWEELIRSGPDADDRRFYSTELIMRFVNKRTAAVWTTFLHHEHLRRIVDKEYELVSHKKGKNPFSFPLESLPIRFIVGDIVSAQRSDSIFSIHKHRKLGQLEFKNLVVDVVTEANVGLLKGEFETIPLPPFPEGSMQ